MEVLNNKRLLGFTQPIRQIGFMALVLGLAVIGAYFILPNLAPVFFANLYLNGFIFIVFLSGVVACFWQLAQLTSSVRWIEKIAEMSEMSGEIEPIRTPRLLASLEAVLNAGGFKMKVTSGSARIILDSIAIRMDESRDITRYIINLLIFLGLLGTFYGLAITIPGVVDTIRTLNPQEGESGVESFGKLMNGLETQLAGMGTAFSSSLLGLAGSLVVGLLELFAGHGQNRFYREMEEWLSSVTKFSFASSDGDAMPPVTSELVPILNHILEQNGRFGDFLDQLENSRKENDQRADKMVETVLRLVERIDQSDDIGSALKRVAQGQEDLVKKLTSELNEDKGDNAESGVRLRGIENQLIKILNQMISRDIERK
jgi:hypothetical protein